MPWGFSWADCAAAGEIGFNDEAIETMLAHLAVRLVYRLIDYQREVFSVAMRIDKGVIRTGADTRPR